ncbi:MAG: AAC(3) family N-acetyltransferase [Erysipelotrichaceae bacterium]
MITVETLTEHFKALKIEAGDVIEVHASLDALGFICGGAEAILTALLKLVGHDGTLVTNAHQLLNQDPALLDIPIALEAYPTYRKMMLAYHGKQSSIDQVDALSYAVQLKDLSLVSPHPTYAVMAYGKQAKWITQTHALENSFSDHSPYARCLELKAKVLLLGVDYSVVSSLHLAEFQSKNRPLEVKACALLKEGQRKWVEYLDYAYQSDYLNEVGMMLEADHQVSILALGNSQSKLFMLEKAIEVAKEYLSKEL